MNCLFLVAVAAPAVLNPEFRALFLPAVPRKSSRRHPMSEMGFEFFLEGKMFTFDCPFDMGTSRFPPHKSTTFESERVNVSPLVFVVVVVVCLF